ncbi:MAG: DUF3090 family protein [Chloroflexi bacterium]|nr:DUF3090 family protein [Chloroflexota bacterium]
MSADRARAQHDIGLCSVLEAEAVGQPGERFFRLHASEEHGSALLWLEKEELRELGHTIKRMLRSSVNWVPIPQPTNPDDFLVDFDFKVLSLTLGHDRDSKRYMLLAQITEEEGDAMVLWADGDTMDHMADQVFEIVDAGRPRCALCGAPTEEGKAHACPRYN